MLSAKRAHIESQLNGTINWRWFLILNFLLGHSWWLKQKWNKKSDFFSLVLLLGWNLIWLWFAWASTFWWTLKRSCIKIGCGPTPKWWTDSLSLIDTSLNHCELFLFQFVFKIVYISRMIFDVLLLLLLV